MTAAQTAVFSFTNAVSKRARDAMRNDLRASPTAALYGCSKRSIYKHIEGAGWVLNGTGCKVAAL